MEEKQNNQNPQQGSVQNSQQMNMGNQKSSKGSFFKSPFLWIIVIILLGLGVAWGMGLIPMQEDNGNRGDVDNNAVVAVVNGEEVIQSDLNARVMQIREGLQGATTTPEQDQQIEDQAIEALINEQLILQAAENEGIEVTEKEIADAYDGIKKNFETEEEFNTEIENQGLTEEILKANIEQQLLTQKYLTSKIDTQDISVTEEEVTQTYNQIASQQENTPALNDEIREQLRNQLLAQKQNQKVSEHINQLKENANIEKM